jgi:serine/threonine protein kinase
MGANEPFDLLPPFDIPIEIYKTTHDFTIPMAALPKQYIDATIRVLQKVRCSIHYRHIVNRGGYGKILLANRTDLSGVSSQVCVKAPHTPTFSLCPEALIQWMASSALIRAGVLGAIPLVYDIFQYAGETRFSMSYVNGSSCIDYITSALNPQRAFLEILVQASMLLGFLEETIHLDHRDLKADNIWIRHEPIHYTVSIAKKQWTCSAQFQVVLLDFGFSCLGGKNGDAVVSLSDGILPRIDPCPKEGRDLFQLLSSLWCLPQIRERMSTPLTIDIELLLSYKNKPYIDLVHKTLDVSWVYLLVSDIEFTHPPLHPISLLHMLSIKYPYLHIQCE